MAAELEADQVILLVAGPDSRRVRTRASARPSTRRVPVGGLIVRVQPGHRSCSPIVSWRTAGLSTPGVRVQLAVTRGGAGRDAAPDRTSTATATAEHGEPGGEPLHPPRMAAPRGDRPGMWTDRYLPRHDSSASRAAHRSPAAPARSPLGSPRKQRLRVAHLHEGVELEREQRRVLGGIELARLLRLAHPPPDQLEPRAHHLDEPLAYRPRVRVELRLGGGEEAAAGKDALLQVGEEVVRRAPRAARTRPRPRAQARSPRRRRSRRPRRPSRAGAPPSSRSARTGRSSTCRCGRPAARSRARRALRPSRARRRVQDRRPAALAVGSPALGGRRAHT